MKTKTHADRRRLALVLLVLGLSAAALGAPGAALAAGGDVLWSLPWTGAGYDDAVAAPAGPSGSAMLCSTLTAAAAPVAVVQQESIAGVPDWTSVWGNDLAGGAIVRSVAYDSRRRVLYLVTVVKDPVHTESLAVVKLDSAGSVVWTRSLSARSISHSFTRHAGVDRRGNLYVAGSAWVMSDLSMHAFLLKFSPRGALLWERNWWSGSWEVEIEGLAVSPTGTAYCVGVRQEMGSTLRSFVRAVSPSGAALWMKDFGGSGARRPIAGAVALAPGGSVVAVGRRDGTGVVKGVAEKYDAAGRLLWRRAVSTGTDGDGFLAVAVGADGKAYAAGASAFPDVGEAGPYVVALRPSGRVAWRSQWNHEGWGQRVVAAGTQVYVATSMVEGAADNDVVGLVCLNATNGSTTWRREYDAGSGATSSEINDLTVVPGQSVYVAAAIDDEVTGSDGWFLRLQP
jgi:hypothetical protein